MEQIFTISGAKRRGKKRRRGLGGSPAEHAEAARKAGRSIEVAASNAKRFAEKGDCFSALGSIRAMYQNKGHYSANTDFNTVHIDDQRAADVAFVKHCLKK